MRRGLWYLVLAEEEAEEEADLEVSVVAERVRRVCFAFAVSAQRGDCIAQYALAR